MKIVGKKIVLELIENEFVSVLWELIYSGKNPEWKKYDAPYFPLKHVSKQVFIDGYNNRKRLGIWLDNKLIGTVSYYWEHKQSNWLEVGISIYSSKCWGLGYGREALTLWISHLFTSMPIVRVGLSTWSGNKGMMGLAKNIGMKQEACLRKCRLWEGEYYDSIRYGVLREEWY